MTENQLLAQQFEDARGHLRGVAYRMLGSLPEAEDAVQEAWLRLSRSDVSGVDNLRGWLTTVVARVCLDMLRARQSRREEPLEIGGSEPRPVVSSAAPSPEQEAVLADSLGLALLVVLDTLAPAERIAFVLHDMFGLAFEDIAAVVGRSPAATRQLASRARRRVRGAGTSRRVADLDRQRSVVDRFLAALRSGDVDALVAVLDPDVVVRADATAAPEGAREIHGARAWASGAVVAARGARFAQPALVDGGVGVVVAPQGRLFRVLRFEIRDDGRIARVDIIGDPERLRALRLGVLDAAGH